jgi:small-conductance mechanosensitive channel
MLAQLAAHASRLTESHWLVAFGVLAVWIVVLSILKQAVVALSHHILKWPHFRILGVAIDVIAPEATLLIVVSGIELAAQVVSLGEPWRSDVRMLVVAGFVAALVMFADRIARLWLRRAAAWYPLFSEDYGLVTGAVRGIIIALGVLMFLDSLGISIGPLLASLGIGSLVIALALQETVKNTFSGIFLIADKPLQVGDYVKLQTGQEGQLFKLGWRSSKFRMLTKEVVVVPNSQLVDSIVTNYRVADGNVGIPIDLAVLNSNDPAHVERVVREVARETVSSVSPNGSGHEPHVLFRGINGNLMNLTVLVQASSSDLIGDLRSEFIKRVLARFASEEIRLPA